LVFVNSSSNDNIDIEFNNNLVTKQPKLRVPPVISLNVGKTGNSNYPVYIGIDAWLDLLSHAFSVQDREIGGVLVGELCTKPIDQSNYLDITASIEASNAVEERDSLKFTHDTWNDIYIQVEQSYKGFYLLGWYHSHPGFNVFMSNSDKFIHSNFFSLSYQIAVVVDPILKKLKIFYLEGGDFKETGEIFVYINVDNKIQVMNLLKFLYPNESPSKAEIFFNKLLLSMERKDNKAERLAVCISNERISELPDDFFSR